MRKNNLLRLLTISCFLSLAFQPHQALAQWPTLDISSVKEGISSNIELVKQSKIVTDTMATTGKINSAIGDAKASVSKYAGDNLQKAQEEMKKLQEEKERIEKRKKEYEKVKKEMEEKKEAVEDYKRQAEALKSQTEEYKSEAKEMTSSVSEKSSKDDKNVSETVSSNNMSGANSNADLNTPQTVTSTTNQSITSGRTAFGVSQSITEDIPQVLPPTSDSKNYGEQAIQSQMGGALVTEEVTSPITEEVTEEQQRLQAEMDALDQERAELEVDAMFAKSPEEKAAIEEKMKALDEKYKELKKQRDESQNKPNEEKKDEVKSEEDNKKVSENEAKTEAEQDKEDEAKAEAKKDKEDKEQSLHRPKILDGETSTKMEIPESHRAKILDTYEAPKDHRPKILDMYEQQRSQGSAGGFRKRATPKTSAMDGKHYALRSFSETMVFADLTSGDVPDGTVNGVFIFSTRLAQECGVNVKDLEDETIMDKCIKELVKDKSDADASIAQEAEGIYKAIMQETVNALIAESMAKKNEAANYETEVLKKMEETIADTKTTRDDTAGLSLTNMQTQFLLNRILTIYSGQISLDALSAVGGFDKSYYQDGDEEENGEE